MEFINISKFTEDCRNLENEPSLLTEKYIDNNLILEFKQNIVSLPTKEGKEGVILHYLYELNDCLNSMYFHFPMDEENNEIFIKPIKAIDEINIIGTFLRLFEVIQFYCMIYKLDFFKLCHDLGFDFSLIPLTYFEIENNENEGLQIELQQPNEKIYLLNDLGIIEELRKKFKGLSNLKIGEILYPITGIIPNTTAQNIGRIQNGNVSKSVISKIESLKNRLKIN